MVVFFWFWLFFFFFTPGQGCSTLAKEMLTEREKEMNCSLVVEVFCV